MFAITDYTVQSWFLRVPEIAHNYAQCLRKQSLFFFHVCSLIISVYSIPTSALITLNVKEYNVTLLKS